MSELEARERYYWSKIRQALKVGDIMTCRTMLHGAERESNGPDFRAKLQGRIGDTFTAGCIALGDPAPLDKEQDHE